MFLQTIRLKEGSMKLKHRTAMLFMLVFGIFLIGYTGLSSAAMVDIGCDNSSTNAMLQGGEYQKKIANFLILQDTSTSMGETLPGSAAKNTKIQYSRALLNCLNNTLPDSFTANAGLRNFGFMTADVGLVYGVSEYTKEGLETAVNSLVGTAGVTPLSKAITFGSMDIKDLNGQTAVILVSDGVNTAGPDPVAAAAAMKEMYGDNVCIYTVQIGDNAAGKKTLEKIAAAGKCGFATNKTEIGSAAGMEKFVTDVFLAKAPPKKIAKPVAPPPDLDSDGDGVPDSRDKCPDTPKGIKVDSNGCPVKIEEKVSVTLLIEFDFDKAAVKPVYHNPIEKLANFLKAYPDKDVELEGHTDSIGPDDYNMKLSKRRAESVKKYLVDKFGIEASRIGTIGYGESAPVATNDTEEGRQKNRRVVAIVEATIAK
jgi:OOP family OmpA-OmpF porin